MHFADQEHQKDGASERTGQGAPEIEPCAERALDKFGFDEVGGPGPVRLQFPATRALIGAGVHQGGVTRLEQVDQLGSVLRHRAHLRCVVGDCERPEAVVRVFGPLVGHVVVEHDRGGFVQGELGAFDEVREVRLVEGQQAAARLVFGAGGDDLRGGVRQRLRQACERVEAYRVHRSTGGAAGQGGRVEPHVVAGLECRSDQPIEEDELGVPPESRGEPPGLVAKLVQPRLATRRAERVQPGFHLFAVQGPGTTGPVQAIPGEVVQQGACLPARGRPDRTNATAGRSRGDPSPVAARVRSGRRAAARVVPMSETG